MFVACGQNECGMFDALSGSCRQCFRVISPNSGAHSELSSKLPLLRELNVSSSRKFLKPTDLSMKKSERLAHGHSINAFVGSVGESDSSSLITGGEDGIIRHWDFASPAKCYTISGQSGFHHRPTFERIDAESQRLMICREAPAPRYREIESSRAPRMLERGLSRTENRHQDSVQDVKIISFPSRALISCSRNGTVKLWR